MNMKRTRKLLGLLSLPVVMLFLPMALPAQESVKSIEAPKIRIAVVPFQTLIPQDGSSTVRCPICASVNSSGTIVKGAERIVEDIFTEKLKELKNAEMISSERAAGFYRRISADSLKQPFLKVLQKVGAELKADVIAVGFVYRYRERVGYDYSAERPASVAFEIHLISVKDGSSLWRGIYDETQKSLMENVFQVKSFVKGGGKWLTAREFSRLGVDEVFKTFSGFEK